MSRIIIVLLSKTVYIETFEKRSLLPNYGVRLKFLPAAELWRVNPRNTQCMSACPVGPADRTGVVKFSPALNLNKFEHFSKVSYYNSILNKIIRFSLNKKAAGLKPTALKKKTMGFFFFCLPMVLTSWFFSTLPAHG
jgi:hypothetical protein